MNSKSFKAVSVLSSKSTYTAISFSLSVHRPVYDDVPRILQFFFPFPAVGQPDRNTISIGELLDIRLPDIYLVRIEGCSVESAGIFEDDMDRS